MASQEDQTRNEYLKDLADREAKVAEGIAEIVKDQKGSAKDRHALVKQGVTLEKSHRTLGGDLTKNVKDMKDGISTTIDGMINETFGPLGGVVSTFTTGWFKRSKDNKDNLSATEATLELAEANLEEIKGGKVESKGSISSLESEQKKTTRAIKGGRETAEEEEKEDDKQHKQLIDALKDLKGGKGEKPSLGDDGGFFAGLGLVASVLGGIALGFTQGTWIPPVKELKNITSIFDTKFPKFTKGIQEFFGMKIPDVPKVPSFTDEATKVTASLETWKDGVRAVIRNADGTFAKATDGLTEAAKGLKVGEQVAEGGGTGSKIAAKARAIMGIELPNWMNSIATKMDESVTGMKAAVESQGIVKSAAKMGVKMGTSVFGRIFAIAGNPIFDVAAMAKDAYDIAEVTMDDDIRTQAKAEDWGGLIGGIVGGTIGAFFGAPWIGVGLGNLAGEFIGAGLDHPAVEAGIAKVKAELDISKAQADEEIASLTAQMNMEGVTQAQKDIYQKLIDDKTATLTSINGELTAIAGLQPQRDELEKTALGVNKLYAQRNNIEAQIEKAREDGNAAAVKQYQDLLKITEDQITVGEEKYETQKEDLRDAARGASESLATQQTRWIDQLATSGNWFGSLLEKVGIAKSLDTESKEGANLMLNLAKEDLSALEMELGDVQGREVMSRGGEGLKNRQLTRIQNQIIAKTDEIAVIEEKISGMAARGAFIVNRPSYLPSSGTVVGEHASWSGRGAARGAVGGVPDGGPEAIVPLGSDRAGAFFDPIAQRMGETLNAQMYARIGGDRAGATATAPNIVDASTVNNVINNTTIRTPSPSGPSLHFEGRDFVHKIA
jgi:hypothetical protein